VVRGHLVLKLQLHVGSKGFGFGTQGSEFRGLDFRIKKLRIYTKIGIRGHGPEVGW
jgi:hypothetical protein